MSGEDIHYDFIILGTGLTECILSGLLSVEGKRVLHIDRNDYYGGECASLNLGQLFKRFRPSVSPPANLGKERDYNLDLIPKFMLSSGTLTNLLIHTGVTRYLEFKQIASSFVYRDEKVSKVPSTDMEALMSPLLGFFEKRRCKKFFEFVEGNESKNESGTMLEVYKRFGLEPGTQDLIGHSLALYSNDEYLLNPFKETRERINLYNNSLMRFGISPFIYPLYGLGELPQAFARLSAVYGGTYMLGKPIDKLLFEQNRIMGIQSGSETFFCKALLCDASYYPVNAHVTSQILRCLCILSHPIPGTQVDSCQLILPQKQIGRQHDIYITCLSASHSVCPAGMFVSMISTVRERAPGQEWSELKPALDLLGPIIESFLWVTPIYEISQNEEKGIFVSASYDASSHFETVYLDVMRLYEGIMGKKLDLEKLNVGEMRVGGEE